MPPTPTPLYLDWQFWAAVVAFVALVLSQLPPVHLWFRSARLEIESHNRWQITHKVGNPNVSMFLSVRNTGGRNLRIRSMVLSIERDGNKLCTLPAQNYQVEPTAKAPVLFVPFTLKPGDEWNHLATFLNLFDRTTEKRYRGAESALRKNILDKFDAMPEQKRAQTVVDADPAMVQPFIDLFHELFLWNPGEYVVELIIETDSASTKFGKTYRFTLYESDSEDLKSYTEDYSKGIGIYYSFDMHGGLFVPIHLHG